MNYILVDIASVVNIPRECSYRIAIIPIGSLEHHGETLPLGTDSAIASKIIDYCVERIAGEPEYNKACLLKYPVLQYGFSPEWLSFEGTVSVELEVFISLMRSILKSIRFNVNPIGYIIVNAHGSNYYPIKSLIQECYVDLRVPIIVVDIWRLAGKLGVIYCHACELEAELYHKLTGIEAKGSGKTYCRELDGVYIEYSEGYCGEKPFKRADEILGSVCSYFSKAIKIILEYKR